MSADLRNVKSLIIVFAMKGCPACEEYTPKLVQFVQGFQAHGIPFVFYTHGELAPGQIPVLVYDAAAQDPDVQALADQYKVEALPTTVLLARNARPVKLEGALEDNQIYELLASAAIASR